VPWASATEANAAAANATIAFFIESFLGEKVTPTHRVDAINGHKPDAVDIIPGAEATNYPTF
jgi:hypothetical protein